jgi:hypothetical protein
VYLVLIATARGLESRDAINVALDYRRAPPRRHRARAIVTLKQRCWVACCIRYSHHTEEPPGQRRHNVLQCIPREQRFSLSLGSVRAVRRIGCLYARSQLIVLLAESP